MFPYGLMVMGVAATMGIGVWYLTGRVSWERRRIRFMLTHATACTVFATGYGLGFYLPGLLTTRPGEIVSAFVASPLSGWNVMMGSWLYLIVAGLSYAVRGQHRLLRQISAAADARAEARRAQLAALRARLNPHFLFNALHSVGAMIKSDPVAADEALDRLGGLLRYVLDDADDSVTFRDEWRFTVEYLALEQLRLGDRLRVIDEVDPRVMGVEVPALLLQPLVENAIRHGIAPAAEGGTLTIRALLRQGRLQVEVHDDGRGDPGGGADRPGIGLGTIRDRLKVLYDDRATLAVAAPPQGGFGVVVTLPVEAGAPHDSRTGDGR